MKDKDYINLIIMVIIIIGLAYFGYWRINEFAKLSNISFFKAMIILGK